MKVESKEIRKYFYGFNILWFEKVKDGYKVKLFESECNNVIFENLINKLKKKYNVEVKDSNYFIDKCKSVFVRER